MRKLLISSLVASTALIAPAAHAQDDELSILRAQLAAMEAQIDTLNQRLDGYAANTQQNAAQIAAVSSVAQSAVAATESNQAEIAEVASGDGGIEISFSGAPEIEAPGGWSFKPFGRIQADAGFSSLPDDLGLSDGFGSEIRRARLGLSGDIPGGFGYKFEIDFAGNSAEVTDAILTYKDDGLKIAIGQHNNFQSLEELSSSRFTSFIERAAFTDAFGFERRLGVSATYTAGDFMVQAGVFTDNIDDLPGQSWSLDGRAVFAPEVGDTQLHLGASAHWADLESGDSVRYRQRPLVHFTGSRLINTGNLQAESEFGLGLEAAAISGPFHVVGEAFWQSVDRPGMLSDPTFFGGYAEVGMFLTEGDSRGYKGGKFDRTRPASPVDEGGIGAIQVNLRYDYLDLSDNGIVGGQQNGYLASLVWVPTDYTRFMLNYGHLEYDNAVFSLPSGSTSYSADVFGIRGQVDF